MQIPLMADGNALSPILFEPDDLAPVGSIDRDYIEAVDLLNLWDISLGDDDASVCIIDNGLNFHEDLEDESLVSRVVGTWNAGDLSNDVSQTESVDHGTHVTGIAAATIDNNLGITGGANVPIYFVKFVDTGDDEFQTQIGTAIRWCADRGPNVVINLSINTAGTNSDLDSAIDYAFNDKGALLVAAAGNEYGGSVVYPAKLPQVIAVSSVDHDKSRSSFSSKGPEVELAAFGNDVNSLMDLDGYQALDGTSMAAPRVSGIAALLWSIYPNLKNWELRVLTNSAAERLGTEERDENFGFGLVQGFNAYNAIIDYLVPSISAGPASVDVTTTHEWTFTSLMAGPAYPLVTIEINWGDFPITEFATIEYMQNPLDAKSIDISHYYQAYGVKEIRVRAIPANDPSAVWSDWSEPFQVAVNGPEIEFISHNDQQTVSGTTTLGVKGNIPYSPNHFYIVSFYIDGLQYNTNPIWVDNDVYISLHSWNTNLYPNGAYTIGVSFWDFTLDVYGVIIGLSIYYVEITLNIFNSNSGPPGGPI